ncbi:MAG TPA: hypothetical protein VG370_21475 [Chloroflexota bacterium]|nr:hypothetical protein [Chloroflexota bacterium]
MRAPIGCREQAGDSRQRIGAAELTQGVERPVHPVGLRSFGERQQRRRGAGVPEPRERPRGDDAVGFVAALSTAEQGRDRADLHDD